MTHPSKPAPLTGAFFERMRDIAALERQYVTHAVVASLIDVVQHPAADEVSRALCDTLVGSCEMLCQYAITDGDATFDHNMAIGLAMGYATRCLEPNYSVELIMEEDGYVLQDTASGDILLRASDMTHYGQNALEQFRALAPAALATAK